jgi:riboflavin synthase
MFTGIIEELGTVTELTAGRLSLRAPLVAADAREGDSIAVDGVCLTVVGLEEDRLRFDLSPETIVRSNLGRLAPGAGVNLERPVTLATRLGGHLVQGHVDGTGRIRTVEPDGAGGALVTVEIEAELERYLIEKGSVTVDGISLTVASLVDGSFTIAVIPHTLAVTTLGSASPGELVNLEVDMIAKYVERLTEGARG